MLCQVSVTVHVSVIGVGQGVGGAVVECPSVANAEVFADGEGAVVMLWEFKLPQLLQSALCGKNS